MCSTILELLHAAARCSVARCGQPCSYFLGTSSRLLVSPFGASCRSICIYSNRSPESPDNAKILVDTAALTLWLVGVSGPPETGAAQRRNATHTITGCAPGNNTLDFVHVPKL